MNIKQITGVTTLFSLFAASVYAESYRYAVCSEYNNETPDTKFVTDDTIKTKGYQDKAYAEASMKMDSIKKVPNITNFLNRFYLEDEEEDNVYTGKKEELGEQQKSTLDNYDDDENDFFLLQTSKIKKVI